jgi:hypothetical protein
MRNAKLLLVVVALLASKPRLAYAARALAKVLVTTGSANAREGARYVAQDQGYSASTGSTSRWIRCAPVRLAWRRSAPGKSLLHWGSVSAANLGAVAAGADLVFVAGFINKLTGAFGFNPEDLRGKSLASTA